MPTFTPVRPPFPSLGATVGVLSAAALLTSCSSYRQSRYERTREKSEGDRTPLTGGVLVVLGSGVKTHFEDMRSLLGTPDRQLKPTPTGNVSKNVLYNWLRYLPREDWPTKRIEKAWHRVLSPESKSLAPNLGGYPIATYELNNPNNRDPAAKASELARELCGSGGSGRESMEGPEETAGWVKKLRDRGYQNVEVYLLAQEDHPVTLSSEAAAVKPREAPHIATAMLTYGKLNESLRSGRCRGLTAVHTTLVGAAPLLEVFDGAAPAEDLQQGGRAELEPNKIPRMPKGVSGTITHVHPSGTPPLQRAGSQGGHVVALDGGTPTRWSGSDSSSTAESEAAASGAVASKPLAEQTPVVHRVQAGFFSAARKLVSHCNPIDPTSRLRRYRPFARRPTADQPAHDYEPNASCLRLPPLELLRWRLSAGLTQDELGDILGLKGASISRVEFATPALPTALTKWGADKAAVPGFFAEIYPELCGWLAERSQSQLPLMPLELSAGVATVLRTHKLGRMADLVTLARFFAGHSHNSRSRRYTNASRQKMIAKGQQSHRLGLLSASASVSPQSLGRNETRMPPALDRGAPQGGSRPQRQGALQWMFAVLLHYTQPTENGSTQDILRLRAGAAWLRHGLYWMVANQSRWKTPNNTGEPTPLLPQDYLLRHFMTAEPEVRIDGADDGPSAVNAAVSPVDTTNPVDTASSTAFTIPAEFMPELREFANGTAEGTTDGCGPSDGTTAPGSWPNLWKSPQVQRALCLRKDESPDSSPQVDGALTRTNASGCLLETVRDPASGQEVERVVMDDAKATMTSVLRWWYGDAGKENGACHERLEVFKALSKQETLEEHSAWRRLFLENTAWEASCNPLAYQSVLE